MTLTCLPLRLTDYIDIFHKFVAPLWPSYGLGQLQMLKQMFNRVYFEERTKRKGLYFLTAVFQFIIYFRLHAVAVREENARRVYQEALTAANDRGDNLHLDHLASKKISPDRLAELYLQYKLQCPVRLSYLKLLRLLG